MLRTGMRLVALFALSILIIIPDAFARGGGGGRGGGGFSGGHGFSGGARGFSGGSFSAGRSFSAPRSYSVSRSYSAPRSYSVSRSYSAPRSYAVSRSYSAPRQVAAPRQYSAPQQVARPSVTPSQIARPNISAPQVARANIAATPHVATPHTLPQVHANIRTPPINTAGRQSISVVRVAPAGHASARNSFHLAHAAVRPIGAHALHNKFIAGRAGIAGIHGRAFAQATTFRGHFPNRFWHRHHHFPRFVVIGWAGPLFWPYAYDDFVGYTFYPYATDTFWPYAYDDVYDGIYGRYAYGNAPVRVTGSEPAYSGPQYSETSPGAPVPSVAPAVRTRIEVCKGETAASLTDWPIDQIAQTVEPTGAQLAALENLKIATAKSLDILKSACPNDLPSTPTGRLAAMQKRLSVMLLAVRTVRPALEAFYQSLNDEQKARFNAISPEEAAQSNAGDLTQVCGERASGITSLPIDRIEQTVRPNGAQRVALQSVRDAMSESARQLKSDCPTDRALTPVGRVQAMEQRLDAMSRAVETLKPALDQFYGSLTDEQKERFNRLPPAQS